MVIDVIVALSGGKGVGEVCTRMQVGVLVCLHEDCSGSQQGVSVMIEKGQVTLGIFRIGVEEKMCLRLSKAHLLELSPNPGFPFASE